MKTTTLLAALIGWAVLSQSPMTFAAADVSKGKAKAATCIACHGAAGVSANPLWPNLKGQKDQYLAKQLKDFKTGKRKDPVMGPQAKLLSDADIANLSAYYSKL